MTNKLKQLKAGLRRAARRWPKRKFVWCQIAGFGVAVPVVLTLTAWSGWGQWGLTAFGWGLFLFVWGFVADNGMLK